MYNRIHDKTKISKANTGVIIYCIKPPKEPQGYQWYHTYAGNYNSDLNEKEKTTSVDKYINDHSITGIT